MELRIYYTRDTCSFITYSHTVHLSYQRHRLVTSDLLASWIRAMAMRILFLRKMTVRRMMASATEMMITGRERETTEGVWGGDHERERFTGLKDFTK